MTVRSAFELLTRSRRDRTITVYRRNFAGHWTRNGKPTTSVPERVIKLAFHMTLECEVTVPAKRPRRVDPLAAFFRQDSR